MTIMPASRSSPRGHSSNPSLRRWRSLWLSWVKTFWSLACFCQFRWTRLCLTLFFWQVWKLMFRLKDSSLGPVLSVWPRNRIAYSLASQWAVCLEIMLRGQSICNKASISFFFDTSQTIVKSSTFLLCFCFFFSPESILVFVFHWGSDWVVALV